MKFSKKQTAALAGISLFEGCFAFVIWFTACYILNEFQICPFVYNGYYEIFAISFVIFLINYYRSQPVGTPKKKK